VTGAAPAIQCFCLALKLVGNGQENAIFVMAALCGDAGDAPAQVGLLP
jgi:hypothetical protein